MALADIPTSGQSRRLDSWKEIAEYLRRDVRTVGRWESLGLPLHRVAGGKGRSVVAFTHEIDAWIAGRVAELETDAAPIETAMAPIASAPVTRPLRTITIGVVCALVVTAVGAVMMSGGAVAPLDVASLQVTARGTQVSIADASGASRVIHRFNSGAVLLEGPDARVEDLDADGVPEVLATVSYYDTQAGRAIGSGEFLNLATSGDVRWRFAFDDVMTFADGRVSGPWIIADWQAEPDESRKRIAIAAHDATWWASVVSVLDPSGHRLGTFVNPGWIESVLWRSKDRLAIGGFNNMRNEAMFAMLEANRLDGQGPGSVGTDYVCRTCPSAAPVFYATFARSELNRVTAGRFNRARISTVGDRLVVTTVEMERENGAATASYEFDSSLRFIRARYSDIYWGEHERLELEGRLTHSREQCPERDGPPAIHIWDGARGWTTVIAAGDR